MKQILVMMAVVVLVGCKGVENQSNDSHKVVAGTEVLFKNPYIRESVASELNKPYGRFVPTPKFTETEVLKVTSLNLNGDRIIDTDLKELSKLSNLKKLYLIGNPITDAGLKALAGLQNLDELHLAKTEVTSEGVTELRKALPRCAIYQTLKPQGP